MPLHLSGSLILGPRPSGSGGSSAPATMAAYLTSIGKDSWYGQYLAGTNMTATSAGAGGAVTTDGSSVGSWLVNQSAGSFSAMFHQTSSSKRPTYGTSRNGKPGIYGDSTVYWLFLNSTTALNLSHTVLMSVWSTTTSGQYVYSHNGNNIAFKGAPPEQAFTAGVTGNQVESVLSCAPVASTTGAMKLGISTSGSGTAYYNNAPNLFRMSSATNYSDYTIHELWFTPRLTAAEMTAALKFLA